MPERIHIGNTTIIGDRDDFGNGQQMGYLFYTTYHKDQTLSMRDLHRFLVRSLLAENRTPDTSTGYILGWVAGLLEGEAKET